VVVTATGPERLTTAQALYDALAARDVEALLALLAPDFVGEVSRGMPLGVGGRAEGPEAMLVGVWGVVAAELDTRPEPEGLLAVEPDRVLVLGHYRGAARATSRPHEAAFAHVLRVRGGQVTELVQVTDTHRWHESLAGGR
jgi:uncharacterized protein